MSANAELVELFAQANPELFANSVVATEEVVNLEEMDWFGIAPKFLQDTILAKNGDVVASHDARIEELKALLKAEEKAKSLVLGPVAREALEKVMPSIADYSSATRGDVLSFGDAAERLQSLYSDGVTNGRNPMLAVLVEAGHLESWTVDKPINKNDNKVRALSALDRREVAALEDYFKGWASNTAARKALGLLQAAGKKDVAI